MKTIKQLNFLESEVTISFHLEHNGQILPLKSKIYHIVDASFSELKRSHDNSANIEPFNFLISKGILFFETFVIIRNVSEFKAFKNMVRITYSIGNKTYSSYDHASIATSNGIIRFTKSFEL